MIEANPCQTQIWQPNFQQLTPDIIHDEDDLLECLGEVDGEDMLDSLEEVDEDDVENVPLEENLKQSNVGDKTLDISEREDVKRVLTNANANYVEDPDIFELDSEEEEVALPLTFNCREDLNRKLARTRPSPNTSNNKIVSIPIKSEPPHVSILNNNLTTSKNPVSVSKDGTSSFVDSVSTM